MNYSTRTTLKFYNGNRLYTPSFYEHCEKQRREKRYTRFISAEVDVGSSFCDIYYGRIRAMVFVDETSCETAIEIKQFPWRKLHQRLIIDWAHSIKCGRNGHIYSENPISRSFGSRSMEDECVMDRLIGVMQHRMPQIDSRKIMFLVHPQFEEDFCDLTSLTIKLENTTCSNIFLLNTTSTENS